MIRLALLAILLSVSSLQSAEENALPRTEGKTLAERKIVLANELRGTPSLLIVTFSRAAGNAAQIWTRNLEKKALPKPGTLLYQVSVLEDVPRLFRGMVIGGIRKGVPADKHATFVVLTQDADAWKKAVEHKNDDDPYLIGVDGNGAIRWRIAGAFTEARLQQLMAQLK